MNPNTNILVFSWSDYDKSNLIILEFRQATSCLEAKSKATSPSELTQIRPTTWGRRVTTVASPDLETVSSHPYLPSWGSLIWMTSNPWTDRKSSKLLSAMTSSSDAKSQTRSHLHSFRYDRDLNSFKMWLRRSFFHHTMFIQLAKLHSLILFILKTVYGCEKPLLLT